MVKGRPSLLQSDEDDIKLDNGEKGSRSVPEKMTPHLSKTEGVEHETTILIVTTGRSFLAVYESQCGISIFEEIELRREGG